MVLKVDGNTVTRSMHLDQTHLSKFSNSQCADRLTDRLVSAKDDGVCSAIVEKIVGFFSWVKDCVVSIFRAIFPCCFSSVPISSSTSIAIPLTNPIEEKALFFETQHDFFIKERDKDQSNDKSNFKKVWKAQFESFTQEIQNLLIKLDLGNLGIEKGLSGNDLLIYTEDSFANEQKREDSLAFVRDLEPFADLKGNIYYPMEDNQVPLLLKNWALKLKAHARLVTSNQ